MKSPRPICLVSCIAGLTGVLGSEMAVAAPIDPPPAHQAKRTFDFGRIKRLTDEDLAPAERTKLAITYIQAEVKDPTPTYRSLGVVDHFYILSQLAGALAEGGADRDLLWSEANRASSQECRDVLVIALGLSGDRQATDRVAAYARNTSKPRYLRECAVQALGEIGDLNTVPTLVDLLQRDRFSLVQRSDRDPKSPLERYYPLRDEARLTLRGLRKSGIDLGSEANDALQQAVIRTPVSTGGRR